MVARRLYRLLQAESEDGPSSQCGAQVVLSHIVMLEKKKPFFII